MKKIYDVLQKAYELLKENNIIEANLEAKLLLAHVLNKDKLYLLTHLEEKISSEEEEKYCALLKERIQNKPFQYIVGKQEFMSLDFKVNENVLIPRPDTEILVEKAMTLLSKDKEMFILDMCTGSGCIGISLAYYLSNAKIVAVDLSDKALEIAKENAERNKVKDKINFLQSNLFKDIPEQNQFDMIVSNPPYIRTDEIPKLMKEVSMFEPLLALDGGTDGLEFYERITKTAFNYLKPKGYLILEVGHDQSEDVLYKMKDLGYENVFVEKDLSKIPRVVGGQRPEK